MAVPIGMLVAACSFDWDTYDPRLGTGGTTATGGTGGAAGHGGAGASTEGGGGLGGDGAAGLGGNGTGGDGGHGGATAIRRVQHGSAVLGAGEASLEQSIEAVDPSRSLVLFGSRFQSDVPGQTQTSGQLTSATGVTFARNEFDGAPAIPLAWYVAEFESGVSVQRGTTTLPQTDNTVPLTTPVDLSKSFPIISFRTVGTIWNVDDMVRAKLTSPTSLTLSIWNSTSVGSVEWQVVSFEDAVVQTGDVSFGANDTVRTDAVQTVDVSRSWLLLSYSLGAYSATPASHTMWTSRLSSSTELTLEREATGPAGMLTYYLVTFTNGSSVQAGHRAVAASSPSESISLTSAIDPDRTVAVSSGLYQRTGATGCGSSASLDLSTFTFELAAPSTLTVTRAVTGSSDETASLDWQVVQFE